MSILVRIGTKKQERSPLNMKSNIQMQSIKNSTPMVRLVASATLTSLAIPNVNQTIKKSCQELKEHQGLFQSTWIF